jgi:hypothetical protein
LPSSVSAKKADNTGNISESYLERKNITETAGNKKERKKERKMNWKLKQTQ